MKKMIAGLIFLVLGLYCAYCVYKGNLVLGIVLVVGLIVVFIYQIGAAELKKEASEGSSLKVDGQSSYVKITENGNLDFENAKKVRAEMFKNITPNDASLEINIAAGLMLDKDFTGSIKAYEQVIEKYPDRKGQCLGQIGVGEFFLGNYEKALEKYIESKDCGEENETSEYNIWEVCELMHGKGISGQIEKYVDLYPQGKFIKKANKLLA